MTVYRFVQLSDIHFGQEHDGTLVTHDDVRRKLLRDTEKLAEARGGAHLVIVVGDIAYAGKEQEYKRAGAWLDQLTKAANCSEINVRVVPGNHDCDLSQASRLTEMVHRNIRSGTTKSANADLEDMAKGSEETNPLLPKFRAYRDFAAGYDSDFASVSRPMWTKDFTLAPGIELRLVGMNSAQISSGKDRPADLLLGNRQYVLPDENHLIYIVIMHHPLDWFMDKAEAKLYLHKRARVIMVGHEHIPDINKSSDTMKNEWLDIYSGATNPPESGALYHYTYNWIEVSLREKEGKHFLAVEVFPRVWVPEQTQFAPDSQRLAGHESAEFEIACPELRPPKPQEVANVAPTSAAESGKLEQVATGESMETQDDLALAKLKFLFWRYLNWQQRLKVLVQANALPPSAERPVPQTMERVALDNAHQQGKLAEVWDAMMEYLPETRKETNPFNKGKS